MFNVDTRYDSNINVIQDNSVDARYEQKDHPTEISGSST